MAKDTRQKILDSARKLFAERGYEGVSVREICAEAGVSDNAIHYHFKSKKALYRAVKNTIEQAIRQNGRASERDIFDKPGNYNPIMDRYAVDKPCPNCGTAIQKISYLGGSCYICPPCQR